MDNQLKEKANKVAATIALIMLSIMAIGTVLIPAVAAWKHGWPWLLIYPAVLFVTITITKMSK